MRSFFLSRFGAFFGLFPLVVEVRLDIAERESERERNAEDAGDYHKVKKRLENSYGSKALTKY